GIGISLDVSGGGVVEVIGKRSGVASSDGDSGQVKVNFANAVGAVGAGDIGNDSAVHDFSAGAIRAAGTPACEMFAFVWSEDEESVALIDAGGFQIREKGAECGVVI